MTEAEAREQSAAWGYSPDTWFAFRWGVKLGPLTICTYRYFRHAWLPWRKVRLSWTWMGGKEHVVLSL